VKIENWSFFGIVAIIPALRIIRSGGDPDVVFFSSAVIIIGGVLLLIKQIYDLEKELDSPLKIKIFILGVGKAKENFKTWVYVNRRTGDLDPPTKAEERILLPVSDTELTWSLDIVRAPRWKYMSERDSEDGVEYVYMLMGRWDLKR
jgi:hypothetical protein